MRDAFAVLFFVSVGMLLDPGALVESPGLVIGALGVVLIGKPLVALFLVWAMKYPFRAALTVGIALAQIGEFSFILATIGRELGVLTAEATNALGATSIASIVLNPLAYRTIRPIERWLGERPRLWALLNRESAIPSDMKAPGTSRTGDPAHRAVVIGFGPTGRTVVRLLRDNGIAPTVIELNVDAVRALRQDGVDAIYGDATRRKHLTRRASREQAASFSVPPEWRTVLK
jgi:CPA2 family monovalent cation:H+ antiporter-2